MPGPSPTSFLCDELNELKQNWIVFLLLGIGLVLLGFLAIAWPLASSLSVIIVLGCFLIVGGIFQMVGAFWTRGWGAFFMNLLLGLLYFFVGLFMLERKVEALAIWTLFIAVGLLIGGVFRIVVSLTHQFAGWGWILVGGVIDVILGLLIWRQFPESSLWVIGLFLGISLLYTGGTWVGLALSLKSLPDLPTGPTGDVPAPEQPQ